MLFTERLKRIKFSDISTFFPKEYFLLDFEPLYTFDKIIKTQDIVLFDSKFYQKSDFQILLDNLFIKKQIGIKRLQFLDFSGLECSKNSGKQSFDKFKKQQYDINYFCLFYKDYDSVRYDVFNTDKEGNSCSIKDATILQWSKSIYANNSDRSHRFALLCKWNELENRNDSEVFNTTEYSLDLEKRKEFLENYYGFIVASETAYELCKIYSFTNLRMYSPLVIAKTGKLVGLIFCKNNKNRKIIDFLKQANNCININDLL